MKRKVKLCTNCDRKISYSNYERHINSCKGKIIRHKIEINADLSCPHCSSKRKSKNSYTNHVMTCPNNPNRIVPWVTRVKGSGLVKAWNKGLTKEIDPRVSLSDEAIENCRQASIGRKYSDDFREKCRENAIKKGLGGVRPSKRIKYKEKILGSSYELAVAISLDENNVRWDTCKRIKYIDPSGKERTYTPDFYLQDYDVYLDPKNDFLLNSDNPALGFSDIDKIKLVEMQNNIRVLVLDKFQLDWNTIKTLL